MKSELVSDNYSLWRPQPVQPTVQAHNRLDDGQSQAGAFPA
jgi:hypothetical protein